MFYATYFEAPYAVHIEEIYHRGGARTFYDADPYHYASDELADVAAKVGLKFHRIGEWGHPRGQMMAAFTHIDNSETRLQPAIKRFYPTAPAAGTPRSIKVAMSSDNSKTVRRRLIVVLGMHRCGTSLLANFLNTLGVDMGRCLMKSDQWNANGYGELQGLPEVGDEILAQLDRSYLSPKGVLSFADEWWHLASLQPLKQRLKGILLSQMDESSPLWGFKDPRTASLLPLWQEIFDELKEVQKLAQIAGWTEKPFTLTPHGVDSEAIRQASPQRFRDRFGVHDDFVLCVAAVDARKNQLMLAHALRDTDLKLLLVGPCQNPDYLRLCLEAGREGQVRFIDRLPHTLVASAMRAARVHALPSWAEGAALSNLEAAVAGCALVMSNRSSEFEYFGDAPYYCDPADPDSIRRAVLTAWEQRPAEEERWQACSQRIQQQFTWERTAAATLEAYQRTLAACAGHQGHSQAVGATFAQMSSDHAEGGQGSPKTTLRIHWEGGVFVHTSLGLINRELCLRLIEAGHEVSLLPSEPDHFTPGVDARFQRLVSRLQALLGRPVDVHVRHQWPLSLTPPPDGRWVIIQPWEYGSLPKAWVPVINE